MSADLLRTLLGALEEELPRAVRLRERLHAIPEPSHEEHATARLVAEALGTGVVKRVARTGLMAHAGPPGEAVAVRAELDALPIEEASGVPFAATNGFMHACGHDVHMAALAALFWAAGRVGGSLPKPLAALYQPSEEAYPSGADLVVREGALARGTAAVVAAHVHPEVPWGSVSVEAGPVNASSDNLRIIVEGAGGHGAYPHRARDPVLALSSIIVALQSLVSRRLDPAHAAVFSVGWLRAGSAENVIPNAAEARGTLRALDPGDRAPLREMAREIAAHTARAHGCAASVEVTEGEPATVNDPALAEAARSLLPEAGFELAPAMRSCGSDDFGFYGRVSPTLMMFVGLKSGPDTPDVPLHHPRFLPPDEAVPAVARAQAVAFAAAASLDPAP
ncbi:MAG TPA: M20 family metallopeptidase [Rubrobacteraceae bacterium]|nr:M20 family metallopeptidase [Rubrobacteraceae bacterium]